MLVYGECECFVMQMLYVCVHPVAVLNAAFCMTCSLLMLVVVDVVCPLQPSSSVNSGCPGPEGSILVSSRWACPISSQVTDH